MSCSGLRWALLPLTLPTSWIYRATVRSRNLLYDTGLRSSRRLPHPVISVGNLTVGGSGKTPLVAFISRYLLNKGQSAAVLSRGYLRRSSDSHVIVSDGAKIHAGPGEAGDEPVELARSVEGLVVAVGADRFRCGLEVIRQLGSRIFVLDDGFQHRRLFRELDLVCIDAGESTKNLRLLPAGRLREPLSSLNRAGGLVWTRCGPGRPSDSLASRVLSVLRTEVPIFRSTQKVVGFTGIAGNKRAIAADGLRGEPVGLLAAIARPIRFKEDLEATGARVVWTATKRDHHAWRPKEALRLVEQAQERGAVAVVTTGKDAVKLEALTHTPIPLFRMDTRTEMIDREAFEALLESVLGQDNRPT